MLDRKAQKAQKILSLDLVCTPILMSDIIWSRGCELWCFQGHGTIESIDTLSNLSRVHGETGSGFVLEPVPKLVREESC